MDIKAAVKKQNKDVCEMRGIILNLAAFPFRPDLAKF